MYLKQITVEQHFTKFQSSETVGIVLPRSVVLGLHPLLKKISDKLREMQDRLC